MGKSGIKRVDLVCPAFTCDCLETLEEINIEARAAFLQAGGQEFHYIACLNDDPAWITALCEISTQHLGGWPTRRHDPSAELRPNWRAIAMRPGTASQASRQTISLARLRRTAGRHLSRRRGLCMQRQRWRHRCGLCTPFVLVWPFCALTDLSPLLTLSARRLCPTYRSAYPVGFAVRLFIQAGLAALVFRSTLLQVAHTRCAES